MKIRCTADEFNRVFEEINRFFSFRYDDYEKLTLKAHTLALLTKKNGINTYINSEALYKMVEDSVSDPLEQTATLLKTNYSEAQLERLKDMI